MNSVPRDGESAMGDISRLAKILGKVVAPTTALTALLFYFGWSHAYWFFDYFGVNSTLLGLSTTDYLMRSLDGLFVPVTVAAAVGLLVVWARVLGQSRIRPAAQARFDRTADWVVPIAGVALTVNGLSRLFWKNSLNTALAIAPLSLAAGVLLLAWAVRRRRNGTSAPGGPVPYMTWIPVLEWASIFLLVGLSLFWATTDYSAAVGRARAREFIANLSAQPSVILYSERSLSVNAPGVRAVRCSDRDAAYRFRYDGLKLVLQSDSQYVLLPAAWTKDNGVAIVMPRTDALRLELVRASAANTAPEPTC
jgi:hypothetical protein